MAFVCFKKRYAYRIKLKVCQSKRQDISICMEIFSPLINQLMSPVFHQNGREAYQGIEAYYWINLQWPRLFVLFWKGHVCKDINFLYLKINEILL